MFRIVACRAQEESASNSMTNNRAARFEVILDLRATANTVGELVRWLSENLPDTCSYEGCVSAQALQNSEDPNRIVVVGQWLSRTHWQRYIAWRENRGDLATVSSLVEGEPSFTCFDVLGEWRAIW
ncbi:MAG: putative quinol monooxygenase [Gammaproteobacteria bacterium]